MTYIEELLLAMKDVFVKLFAPFLITFVQSLHVGANAKNAVSNSTWDFATAFAGWNATFDKLLKRFEDRAAEVRLRVLRPFWLTSPI